MKFFKIPDWLYFPIKLLLMVTLLVPVGLWAGQMLGFSKAQETALAMKELRSIERQAGAAVKYIEKEGEVIISQAAPELDQMEKEGENMLAEAKQKVLAKTESASEETVSSKGPVKGIDVSHYQGLVHWDRVAETGIHFGFAKATGGMHFVDPRFHENWHGMRTVELFRGAYHFYYAAEDPHAQAKHFIATVQKLSSKDLPPVLDVEITDHMDPKKIVEGTLTWLETVEKALGRRPILYTDLSFGRHYFKDPRLSKYPLWIADYANQVGSLPQPWKKNGWTFWQHSQKGGVQGVSGQVDLNRFNGTIEDLKKFITESKIK